METRIKFLRKLDGKRFDNIFDEVISPWSYQGHLIYTDDFGNYYMELYMPDVEIGSDIFLLPKDINFSQDPDKRFSECICIGHEDRGGIFHFEENNERWG